MEFEMNVEKVIREFNNNIIQEIHQDDVLREVGVDSLGLVNLVVALEDEFNIEFEFSKLNPSKIIYVRDLTNLVERYYNDKEGQK